MGERVGLPVVGFVGLGNMGGAIAQRLAASGLQLQIRDANPSAEALLAAADAVPHPSARSVADAADVVFACLPHEAAARAVVQGPDGLAAGARMRFYVEMATLGPLVVREFAATLARGDVATLDAPVSGGAAAARRGNLTIMTGGPPELLSHLLPILHAITTRVIPVGDNVGDGQTMKLVNNLLAAANMANAFEALVLGVKLGLEPGRMLEVVSTSSGASTGFTARRVDAIRTRRFDNGGHIALLAKDIGLAFAQAEAGGVSVEQLPSLSGMKRLWDEAMRQGMAGEDVTRLVRVIEQRLGVEVRETGVPAHGGPAASAAS